METTHCLNCNNQLETGEKYCSNCSQKTDTHRLTLPEIGHETLHAVTHADKGFLYTIKELAVKPGVVANEYIEG